MANVNVQDLVAEAIKALTPTLAKALADALANAQTAQAEPKTEPQPEPTQTHPKGKGGFRKAKNVDTTFEIVENEINVCEYSEKSIAIWGDTKDKTDLIALIKQYGAHDKQKANFVTPLSAIASRPIGWTINKTALDANGGHDSFLDAVQALGFNVVVRESVKDVFEANKAAREAKAQTEPKTEPTAPKQTAPKGNDKPTIAPTNEQKSKGKATTPKQTAPKVKTPTSVKGCKCYDNCKDGDGYKIVERDLTKRGTWFYAQGEKGAAIYALVGQHVIDKNDIYVRIASVKGDITTAILPEFKTWDTIAKDVYASFSNGTLKASNALMYAYVDMGDQPKVDAVFAKVA